MSALRVLFVCTANAGRSQMAEALANHKGQGRVHAESAGSHPVGQVNPLALDTLREFGVPWGGRPPRSVEGLEHLPWDHVITVCDHAKESCPVFLGAQRQTHWSIPDPNDKAAFRAAFLDLSKRIEALLA